VEKPQSLAPLRGLDGKSFSSQRGSFFLDIPSYRTRLPDK
jgi:hypothetical protein